MKGRREYKPKISIFKLRLCLAGGIGLFLGIQLHLLSYTADLFNHSITHEEPLTIPKLNATGLKVAIRNLMKQSPLFLLGHTTGHSGSGTFQESMAQPGCFWNLAVDKFEYVADGEKDWAFDKEGYDDKCEMTKRELVPHMVNAVKSKAMKMRRYIDSRADDDDEGDDDDDDDDDEEDEVVSKNASSSIASQMENVGFENTAFIDLGHFHNTGRTLECLAKHLGEMAVFIHIRRNRYSIARSFTPSRDETLSKDDWRHMRKQNNMARRKGMRGIGPEDHDHADVLRETPGSRRGRDGGADADDDKAEENEDNTPDESHRRLDASRRKNEVDKEEENPKRRKPKGRKRAHNSGERKSQADNYERKSRLHRLRILTKSKREKRHRPCRGRRCRDKSNNATSTKSSLPQTPCLALNVINGNNVSHPSVSICPRSTEDRGPVNLAISSDDIWDSLTPFQQFLWYADEMEHRWYTLQKKFYRSYKISPEFRRHVPGGFGAPTFIEVTWDNKDELHDGVNWVRKELGCTPARFVTNEHPHVKHDHGTLNCSSFIWQDLEYRKKMKYSSKAVDILFSSNLPQHVDSPECMETKTELEKNIKEYSKFHGIPYDPGQWKLPNESSQH